MEDMTEALVLNLDLILTNFTNSSLVYYSKKYKKEDAPSGDLLLRNHITYAVQKHH